MTRNRLFAIGAATVVLLVGLGAATHASAGEIPHLSGSGCLACALCEMVNHLFS